MRPAHRWRTHWVIHTGLPACRETRPKRRSRDLYDVTCLRCLRRAVRRAGEDPAWAA